LKKWVDEIVIVDDGSTDETTMIAHNGGEKVKYIVTPRKKGEYFADQRNKGIEAAKSDWLIHMDIDERIPPSLAVEILEAIKSKSRDAFKFRRLNYFLHRPMQGGGWNEWNLVHLSRRDVLKFNGMFHEGIVLSIPKNKVGQLNNPIIHLNDASYKERIRKSDNYTEEIVARIRKTGKLITWFTLVWVFIREFLVKFFYKKGFLDGSVGLLWALHTASANFRAHALVWDEQNRIDRQELENQIKKQW